MVSEPFEGYFSGNYFAEVEALWIPFKLKELGLAHLLEEGPFADLGCGIGTVISAHLCSSEKISRFVYDRD
ncbi:MAG: hypothetical protein AB1668_01810 [Nanoarchaeota archaeon]